MIIAMGLPGAGKSTVLSAVPKDWKLLNFGDLMFSIAQKTGAAQHRDELRKLPTEKQKEIQAQVGKELAGMHEKKILIDTHASVLQKDGSFLPGLSEQFLSEVKIEKLIYITAPPEQIKARRDSDHSRKRDEQSLYGISLHDTVNRAMVEEYAKKTAAQVKIILNAQGKVDDARKELLSILK
ncbi:MAG: adenylate kinase [Candidatus Anstonellaceae archaeon]